MPEFVEKELYLLKGAIREGRFSQSVLEKAYTELSNMSARTRDVNKLQAEVCYLMAQNIRSGNPQLARKYAQESIDLYRGLDIQTLQDAVPILHERLPEMMHGGVVKYRLQEVLENGGDIDAEKTSEA